MKYKLISFFLLISTLIHCYNNSNNNKTMEYKDYKYKNNKRIIYGLDVTIPGPYEIYINDILVEFDHDKGMHNTFININQAVLKSGTYNFKVKVYPEPQEIIKGGIQPETLQFLKVGFAKYEKILLGEGAVPNTYEYLYGYSIPKINNPVPYYEVTGEFTVDLPYELDGWSKGQDLRKWEQKELEQKVVSFYQKLWTILNNGEGEKWSELNRQRDLETMIFHYYKKEEINISKKEEIKNIIDYQGMMIPLEDYKMVLYANGKIVSLERKNHTKEMNAKEINAKNESPLIRKGKTRGVSFFPIKLYLPEGSDEFVIIRK